MAKHIKGGMGVGTSFKVLAKKLGLRPMTACNCTSLLGEMNNLGVQGCKDRRDELIAQLRENESYYGSRDKLRAAVLALWTGLAWKIDPLDPIPGLLDEAIRRAEESWR